MTYNEIERIFSLTEDVGFEPNEGKNAGAIVLCFTNPSLPFTAYTHLIENGGSDEVLIKIKEHDSHVDLKIMIEKQEVLINIKKRNFSKQKLDTFRKLNGGGPSVILLIGYPPASSNHVVMQDGVSPLVVKWEFDN